MKNHVKLGKNCSGITFPGGHVKPGENLFECCYLRDI